MTQKQPDGQSTPSSQHLHVFINPEALQTQPFLRFYGAFITSLVKSLTTGDSAQSPAPLTSLEFQSSNHWLIPLATNSPLTRSEAPPQSHLINVTKDILIDLSIGNSKNFRSSTIGKGMKTNYKFLIINHNIRVALCDFQMKHFKDTSPWHPQNTVYVFCFHCSLMAGLIGKNIQDTLGLLTFDQMICLLHEGCPASIYQTVYPHALFVTTKNVPWEAKSPSGKNHCWGQSSSYIGKIGTVDHNIIKPFFSPSSPLWAPQPILWERHVHTASLSMEPAFQSEQAPVNHCCTSVSSFPCPRKFQVNFQPSCYNLSREGSKVS